MPYKNPRRQSTYQRAWMNARRAEWLAANGPCRQCGSWDDLEVDHIDRSEKVSHRVWSWSKERRDAELAKCQPLCEACHKAKTIAQFTQPITHGTRRGYEKGCRCRPCLEAKKAYTNLTNERAKARRQERAAPRRQQEAAA